MSEGQEIELVADRVKGKLRVTELMLVGDGAGHRWPLALLGAPLGMSGWASAKGKRGETRC
jgi:hypothetical protein